MTTHKKAAGESGSIAKQSVMPIVAQNDNNAQQLAHLELIAAQLNISGFSSQGRIIEICRKSGYSKNKTIKLITALVSLGLVELSVTKETPQVIVAICDGVELLEAVQ